MLEMETVRYLMGSAGASGFGSKSTAEEVTEASPDLRSITAIITGATSGIGAETTRVLAKRGSIPDGIERLSNLETLILSSNDLSGKIPGGLAMIKTLYRFAANQNNFNGSIPRGITTYLSAIDLSFNGLTGEIPDDFLSSPELESVDLTNNHLQGPIPPIPPIPKNFI